MVAELNRKPDDSPLATIWTQQRAAVLRLGHAMHQEICQGGPAVTLHGRDLHPGSEGVGFQFQLALREVSCEGRIEAAYFVVQPRLVRLRTSIAWRVDTMRVLELPEDRYELFARREEAIALHDRKRLTEFMVKTLPQSGIAFFQAIHAGKAIDEPTTIYSNRAASTRTS